MFHQYHQHHRHVLYPRSWPGLECPGQQPRRHQHGPALVEEEEDDDVNDDDDRDLFSYYYSCGDDDDSDDEDAEYRQARQVLQEFHRAHSLDVIYERPRGSLAGRRQTSTTPTAPTLLPKTRTAVCLLDLAAGVAEEEEESAVVLVGEDSISSVSPSPSAKDLPSPPTSLTIPPLHCRREGPPPMTHTRDGGGNDDWGYFREDEVEARTSETGAPSLSSFRKPSSTQTLPYHQHRHFQRRLKRSIRFSTQY